MVEKIKDVLKKKKKKWFSVYAKGSFQDKLIGEIPVEDHNTLKDRKISINLMNLTGDIKKQNINLQFLIDSFEENKATAKIISYRLNPGFIKRIVRRDKNKVDDSFTVKTTEGLVVRIKTLFITNAKTKRSIRSELVRASRRYMKDHVASVSFDQLISEAIEYHLQKTLKDVMHKVLPVKNAEIRVIELQKNAKITIDSKLVKQEKKVSPEPEDENSQDSIISDNAETEESAEEVNEKEPENLQKEKRKGKKESAEEDEEVSVNTEEDSEDF
jgi:small subunit ribosomal protein S3Ae